MVDKTSDPKLSFLVNVGDFWASVVPFLAVLGSKMGAIKLLLAMFS